MRIMFLKAVMLLLTGVASVRLSHAGTTFAATEPALLSTGSPNNDEDPSVLLSSDGTLFVAWFSDRGGNSDIYVTSTSDGLTWATPSRVTTDSGGDFN